MNSDKTSLKYIRKLIIALTISGLMNIILMSSFFYWLVKDTPPAPYFEQKPALRQEQQAPLASEGGNAEVIHYFRSLSFDQLVAKLSNNQLIENGYSQRDIALACLIAFHHLDLSRALVGHILPHQERSIIYGRLKNGKPASITVYPALSDQQFQAIVNFIGTERWPLTARGLFWQLKKSGGNTDPSLNDAFSMTPEFLSVEMLFNRGDVHLSKSELQKLLLGGTWDMLSDFSEQQKLIQDLSPARRQSFLLKYIDHHSKTAAYLMLKVDGEFAQKKLDDQHVIALLNLMNEKTPESEKYARDLLTSPRSDSVWKLAGAKLYEYAGEAMPEKNLHHKAMARFVASDAKVETPVEKQLPQKMTVKPVTSKPSNKNPPVKTIAAKPSQPPSQIKKDRLYIVQDGDTLWKIARRFNIDIDSLRHHNRLKNDALKPGTPIRIP